ncbi:TonB-dependent siderophore receptor [Stakelama sp. CBK3Z-3]|uniref:TonB-dependent siderophore receptor n=1 Tax=Stakelama flava TaxID=2860338 RepID=A0ABS6XIM0_9SPHN|nr:TonB-dependent siderophore receptor [Stakelama flava]MBW4329266.1 TonB-dependent siderophore receptor [Stakelama flava]
MRRIAGILFLGAAWPAMAQAQSTDAEESKTSDTGQDRQEIVVTATGLSTATSTTKTDTPLIESPQTISVISREEIDLRASPNIADALAYTAGVQPEAFGMDSRVDEVSVRGFGAGGFSSNNNFVDGLRLPSGGQWTRPGFDPFALQQIEVLKGPSSVLYGQTAPGGIVNIVTKRPTAVPHGEVQFQGIGYTDLGRWNFQGAADAGGPLTSDGTLRGRIVGLARYGETQLDGTKNGRYYISPSLTWAPDDNTTWTLLGQYQRDEGGATFQFLPATGSLNPTNGGYIKNDAYLGEPGWNVFDRNQYLAASFFEHRFGDHITVRNNSRYTHIDTLYRVVVLSGDTVTDCTQAAYASYAGCIDGQTIGRRAVEGRGETDGFATDTQIEVKLNTGAVRHTLLGGVDYFHTDWSHERDLVSLPGYPRGQVSPLLDIFDPQPRGTQGFAENMAPQIYTDTLSHQTGVYGQDQVAIGNLRVAVGGRYDWAKDDTYNPLTDVRYITSSDDFTWRAGAVYLFDNGLAPYFSYSQSFQPQVSDPSSSADGEPFVPTTGDQYEGGVRYQKGRNIYVTLSGYQITQQNVVTTDPAGTLCGNSICSVQTGEARIRGVELEGRASLPFGTTLILSASRQWSKITESNTAAEQGKDLPQVPDWLASAFVSHSVENGALAGLGFGGGVRYTGNSFGTTDNRLAIPDYTLFDLFLRYDLGKADPAMQGLSLSINGRNIADKRFVATCTFESACYYGQGRSVTARIQFKW